MSGNGNPEENLQAAMRQLPSVDSLLQTPVAVTLSARYGRSLLLEAVRASLEAARAAIIAGRRSVPMNAALLDEARLWLEALLAPTLRPVINATGVIIHTNLGRAPLSEKARLALQANTGYGTLEYDVAGGSRGSRSVHARKLLTRLTGAEDALVVNNNAAAVLLMLRALCREREVVISRGQLVEIGGGFRVPDIMAESGARLVEVGTTNRTHVRDYARALRDETAAILVAHHSNFKIVGFATEPSLADLAGLAHERQLPLLYDQGSGAFLDTAAYGLAHEPTVGEALDAGVDLVAFSADKLLGGPQAGIICGRAELVERLRRHPLARALRPDKLCLAALAATLTHYLVGEAEEAVPVWQMISRPKIALDETADQWARHLREQNVMVTVADDVSMVGGGSLPGTTLPTSVLAIDHQDVEHLARVLRSHAPAIIARISDSRLIVDPRTVLPEQEDALLEALTHFARSERGGGQETSVAA